MRPRSIAIVGAGLVVLSISCARVTRDVSTHDGKAFRPDGKSGATLLPAAFGLAGVNLHTYTGSWGNVTYWNAYVANTQMQGQGTFFDPRSIAPTSIRSRRRTRCDTREKASI